VHVPSDGRNHGTSSFAKDSTLRLTFALRMPRADDEYHRLSFDLSGAPHIADASHPTKEG
jgi:hypothetical protein